jgi:uncharacterized protein YndB with AHSA1/START domain
MDSRIPVRKLTIRRTFRAPAAAVFQAFLSAEALREWWSPAGYVAVEAHADARVGGQYRLVMRSQAGSDAVYVQGSYREITPPSKLVFTHTFARQEGGTQYAAVDLTGHQTLVTVVFTAQGEATEVELVQEPLPSAAAEQTLLFGWQEILDKLALYVTRAGSQDAS